MDFAVILTAAVFGLLVGSFLNVAIYRLPVMLQRESTQAAKEYLGMDTEALPTFNLFTPPSRCGHCGARVKPWQNIPVVSWLLLKGRCHSCHTRIGIRYPLVELLTAVLFGIVAWRFGYSPVTVWACLFTAFVITATFIDADTQLLPDELTSPLLWLGLLFNLMTGFVPLAQSVIGAVCGYMSLWSLYWLFKLLTGKEGMGYGDFKMLGAIGAWLGVWILPVVVLSAAIVGIIAAVIKGVKTNQPMAFGPCLAIAGWFVFIFHDSVLNFVAWWLAKSGF